MKINISKHMQKKYFQFFQIVEEKIDILYSYDKSNKSTCHSKHSKYSTDSYSSSGDSGSSSSSSDEW